LPRSRRALVATLALAALLPLATPAARADAYQEFFEAIAENDGRRVETFILRGISTNSADRKLGPAIVYAAQQKSYDAVRALLLSPATNVEVRNRAGETALMFASMHGEIDVVRRLLARGAQLNHPGWTPLHYAAGTGQLPVVQLLLEHHAYIDAASPNGSTPLIMAAREQQPEVARYLVEQGADPSLANEAGLTAADYFQRVGDAENARWMRERAAEFTRRYGSKETPVPAKRP
jgi:ankyrin repeat protein